MQSSLCRVGQCERAEASHEHEHSGYHKRYRCVHVEKEAKGLVRGDGGNATNRGQEPEPRRADRRGEKLLEGREWDLHRRKV